ncbi:MAG: hypothetical protein RMJ96_06210 [Candidatus Bipolaricaulota bacterium]|nr:hypothetical protein [Candidatus Bipolaricaulota bacterium]MDW8111182.1 hypothetical protein [Candidatus Bipolaricaulota bacterium]
MMTQAERIQQAREMTDLPLDITTLYQLGLQAGRITSSDPEQLLDSARRFDQRFNQLRRDAFERVALQGEDPQGVSQSFAQQLENLVMQFMEEGIQLGERYEGKSIAEILEEAAEQIGECDAEELSREFGLDPERVRRIAEQSKEGMKRMAQQVRELELQLRDSRGDGLGS